MGQSARVLVVDKDPSALLAIEGALRNDGYFPVAASDAAGALNAAKRLILHVTSCQEALFAHDIQHSPDDDILEKPFSEEELMDAVQALLYWHRRPRSES